MRQWRSPEKLCVPKPHSHTHRSGGWGDNGGRKNHGCMWPLLSEPREGVVLRKNEVVVVGGERGSI